MRAFAESSDTVRLFKEAALNQNINNGNLLKGKYSIAVLCFILQPVLLIIYCNQILMTKFYVNIHLYCVHVTQEIIGMMS